MVSVLRVLQGPSNKDQSEKDFLAPFDSNLMLHGLPTHVSPPDALFRRLCRSARSTSMARTSQFPFDRCAAKRSASSFLSFFCMFLISLSLAISVAVIVRVSAALSRAYSRSTGHQRSSEVIRGHPRSSEVIRGHPRSSEVIRGHQRSSEVIRGHQSAVPALSRAYSRSLVSLARTSATFRNSASSSTSLSCSRCP